MIKFSNKSLLTLALVLAVCVAALVYNFLNSVQTGMTSKEDNIVVVARGEILANSLITEEMVEEVIVPRKSVQPGALTERKRVVGTYAKETIPSGEQITGSKVLDTAAAGFTGSIPHDKRALSIAVTEVTGVAGLIKPGDYVDVIAVLDTGANSGAVANMIIQNILVLAANKTVNREEPGALNKEAQVTTYTIAVTSDEALAVSLAEKKGTLTLALRPYSPLGSGVAQVGMKTMEDLVGSVGYAERAIAASAASAPPAAPMPNPGDMMKSLFPSAPAAKAKIDYGNKKVVPVIKGTAMQEVFVE